MSIAFALTFLPFLLVSPFGGVIADRLDRRSILIWGDFFSFLIILLIGILTQTFPHSMLLIYTLVFLAATISPIYHPAFQSIIPSIVDKKDLSHANALMGSADNIIMLVAPIVGGGMIALIGIVNAIYLNALSFLVSALLITLIKKSEKIIVSTKMTIASVLQDLKEGFNFAWSHPVLKYGALLFIGSNFAINLFFANFMYYLAHTLALSPAQIGLVFAIIGVGSIGGSLFTPGLLKRFEPGKLISSTTLLAGLISFLLLLTKNPWGVAIIWAIVSGCGSSNVVTYFTLRQQVVPSEYLGRAVATTRLISYSSIPIASILGGWLLGITSIYTIIFWCALLRLVVGLAALFSPLCNAKKKINSETIYDNA
jgi:MFS family permease